VAPGLITRQRQNLGRTRARGVEVDVDARLGAGLSVVAGYAFADSRVVRFEANPALEGLRVPQVPRHLGTLQMLYTGLRSLTVGVQGRAASAQYDDDQNRLRLGGFGTLDAFASYRVAERVEAFVAVENVFDRRYDVGRTPVLTVGPPVTARAGLRLRFVDGP
jgi:outer membrane receptor protein involved in Fe transport